MCVASVGIVYYATLSPAGVPTALQVIPSAFFVQPPRLRVSLEWT